MARGKKEFLVEVGLVTQTYEAPIEAKNLDEAKAKAKRKYGDTTRYTVVTRAKELE